jgi:hypothetical protein
MSNKNEKCIIVGIGQLGKVLFEALKKTYDLFEHDIKPVRKRDKVTRNPIYVEVNADPEKVKDSYMHICFEYSENFISIVKKYDETYKPKLIIIHSCVKPGTTDKLVNLGIPVVHSPCVLDDNNFHSMPYFRKLIGYDRPELAILAEAHLRPCFTTALISGSKSTETADILFNLYSMTCRAITFEMSAIFKIENLDYKVLMEMINYNNLGYLHLNKSYMFLQNMFPDLNKSDFRTKLLDLLPENLQSLFFKLSLKSYGLEKEERIKSKIEKEKENDKSE